MPQNVFCPVCRSPRKADLRDHLSAKTHVQILAVVMTLASSLLLLSGWPAAIKSLLFYLPLWGICEFVYGVRVREATKCPTCHFDPVLYRRDWRAARVKVEKKLGLSLEAYLKQVEERKAFIKKQIAKTKEPTNAPESSEIESKNEQLQQAVSNTQQTLF